ncbi:DUF4493 domain-containing protein [Bacteroides sp.]
MKRLFLIVGMVILILGIASCDSSNDVLSHGVGTLSVGLSATPSFSSKTRAINEDEYRNADNYTVEIQEVGGDMLYNDLYRNMPMSFDVEAGKTYTVKAFYGENVDAGFDKLYMEGNQQFTISNGEQKNLVLSCRPANVKVTVEYTDDFLKYYSDCTVSLQTSHIVVPFVMNMNADANKEAYLKADATGETITILVDGFKDKSGNLVDMGGALTTTKNVTPKTHVTITVGPEVITVGTGEASFDVSVDTSTEDKDINIEIPEEYWPGNAN